MMARMNGTVPEVKPVGPLLRRWREQRGLTQLGLALQAEVSTRHLSFVETGRSVPSREMILHLCEHLDLTLRDRNEILLAAGYAPLYAETPLDTPPMHAVRETIRVVLRAQEPSPAAVVDRKWNLVEANAAISIFMRDVAPELLEPPVNVLRASLHPRGMAQHTVNLGEWRAHLLGRLRRQIAASADRDLRVLYDELASYPCEDATSELDLAGGTIAVPLRIRHGARELAFLSTVTTFGTPLDITVQELAIESFFPADAETAEFLRSASG